jgi:hypothetical protein
MSSPIKGKVHIHLTENESTELDDKGGVKNIGCTGLLSVKNPSTDHRLWNLKMNLDQTPLTNLPKSSQRQTLESGSLWDFQYKVDPIKDPILKLTEIFNTSRERHDINNHFYLNVSDQVSITLTLKNVSDRDIQSIVLQKQIPQYLKELSIEGSSLGTPELDIENKYLTWRIPLLAIEETATLIVVGRADIKDSLVKSGNPVEVTYESDMNSRSKVKPKVEALTDSMSGVEQEEDDTKPGWWNCTVEFDNNSDFELT